MPYNLERDYRMLHWTAELVGSMNYRGLEEYTEKYITENPCPFEIVLVMDPDAVKDDLPRGTKRPLYDAALAVIVNRDTVRVVKNRYGPSHVTYPVNKLPEDIKGVLVKAGALK